ncbi:MAG: nucleotide-binding protein [Candidatus Poribacteria bacterium]|nr:nucleotide-binding protein [Candidatus Poribacteria bacterium]
MSEETRSKVFISHGHDEEARTTVAEFVENLGLNVTVLNEQPNNDPTVIDNLERYADDTGFAIVLLTPDDVGALKDEADRQLNPRARQNVLLELGYLIGKLNPNQVCILYKDGVELPSDIHGVVLYVPMDSADAWKLKLSQGMRNAGLLVDTSQV